MTILLRLAKYVLRHKRLLAAGYVALAATWATSMAIPRLLGTAIDEAIASGIQSRLLLVAVVIVGLAILRAIAHYAAEYLGGLRNEGVVHDLRNDIFEKLQGLSFGFHDRQRTGDLMSRATSDIDAVRWFSGSFAHAGYVVLYVGGVATVMLLMNWRLGLLAVGFGAVALWRSLTVVPIMVGLWRRAQDETGEMTAVVQEALSSIRVVKAFGAMFFEQEKFEEKATAIRAHMSSATIISSSRKALSSLILNGATGAVLWTGANEVAAGRATAGDLAAFLLYLTMLTNEIFWAGFLVVSFTRAASAGQRIFEVLDADSPVSERKGARPLPCAGGHVRLENVSLEYQPGRPAVHDVDLEARPGQVVAILGAPGSGKSSLVHLIPRFYDVSEGRVTIDSVDVRDATLESVRRNVGIVLQDAFAFSATIKDNISYGADSPSIEEVMRVATVAQLDDFVDGLADGYETWVGERGITLSGGQRQRLAIARTLLVDPPVLILDDSTSSVDVATEHRLQKALEEVTKGRTTFVIAHRLSTVRNADLIVVMDRGGIVERGTHLELKAEGGGRGIPSHTRSAARPGGRSAW